MPISEEHRAKINEGIRRAAAARREQKEDISPINGAAEVVYRPFNGDPHTTKVNGIEFRANMPVHLDRNNKAHYVKQLLGKPTTNPDGSIRIVHAEVSVFLADALRENPSFEVDGVRAKKLVNKRILPQAGHGWAEDHEDEISVSRETEREADDRHLATLSAMFP